MTKTGIAAALAATMLAGCATYTGQTSDPNDPNRTARGALIGAVMTAGILTDGKGTPAVSRQLVAGFQEKCGATICKDLKGIETGRVLCSCPECVRNAVLTLGEALKLEEKV